MSSSGSSKKTPNDNRRYVRPAASQPRTRACWCPNHELARSQRCAPILRRDNGLVNGRNPASHATSFAFCCQIW